MTPCPYCGAAMRATMQSGHPPKPDGWICLARPHCPAIGHEIHVMQQMVADLKHRGWSAPCGKDPDTGEPLTLVMMYGRYAQGMVAIMEIEQRHELPSTLL